MKRQPAWQHPQAQDESPEKDPSPHEALRDEHWGSKCFGGGQNGEGTCRSQQNYHSLQSQQETRRFPNQGATDGDDSWVKCALLFFSLAE